MRRTRDDDPRSHDGPGAAPVAHPEIDEDWDRLARNETPTERLDRNWASLLQELRVTQTGVQLLTGFLLILPFQPQFDLLTSVERGIYLATMLCAAGATLLLVAPVGMHRILFRQHRIGTLVVAAHHCALGGMALLGIALAGVVTLTVGAVLGPSFGLPAGGIALALFGFTWLAWPWWLRTR
ncbi:DUF6328 family protein [Rhodococcus sp. NPDC003318]|uniref:DUF6328 family protein n=1 Tax=Rhodococcus sp. NPDC003318 TaxID=3364503 RepID=UPI0036B17DD5